MQRIPSPSTARGVLAVVALLALSWVVPPTASAQESESEKTVEKRVVVEVRDGTVYVNGEKTDVGDEGHFIVRKGNDDDIVIVRRKDGPVWFSAFGDTEEALEAGERAREMARQFRMTRPDARSLFMEFEPGPDFEDFEVDIDGPLREAFGGAYRFRVPSPEVRRLEAEIREKAREIRRADEADRAELESELDALLDRAFDEKLELERSEVRELQERVEELRQRIQERDSLRREIVERRKKELLGRRDQLDW